MRKYGGGSPATEQLNGGIESVDLAGKDSSASSEGSKKANTSLEGGDTSVRWVCGNHHKTKKGIIG